MLNRKTKTISSIDWFTVTIYLVFVIAGWLSVHAATYDYDGKSIIDLSGRAGMQLIWIFSSVLLAVPQNFI